MTEKIVKILLAIALCYIPLNRLILSITVGSSSSYYYVQDDVHVIENNLIVDSGGINSTIRDDYVVVTQTTNRTKPNNNGVAREYDSGAKYRDVGPNTKTDKKVVTQPITKPKLILHVGPRKTATTTIQHFIFWANGGVSKVARALAKDNFIAIHTEWQDVLSLVEDCLLKLPHESDLTKWYRFTSTFDEAYLNKQHVAISNEALSLVKKNEDVKALFLTLTEKWDVRVIIAYRPLEAWYPSMYQEDRKATFHNKQTNSYRRLDSNIPNPCNIPFTEYFNEHWKQKYLGDPLETLETYQYIFGKDKVKTLMMTRPDHVDISQQFICDGLEAKHACAKVKKTTVVSTNKSQRFLFDHDLLVFGAWRRQMLGRKCERHKITKKFGMHLNELNMTIHDLPKVCISAEQFAELKYQSWITETKMSVFPRSKKEFDDSFTQLEKESKFCSVDVGTVLSNPTWANVFRGFPCNLL